MSTPPSGLVSQNPSAPTAPSGVPEGVTLTPLERPSPSLWQDIKTGVANWLDKQEETEKNAESYVQQLQAKNDAEAAAQNQLYETNPQEFERQHPLEYLYRRGYNTVKNALVEPALEGASPALREYLRPKVENLVETGLGLYNIPKVGQAKPAISQGVILPEGGELGEEAEAEAFGAKPWQKTGEEIGPLYHGGKKLVSDVDLAKTGQRDAGFYGKGFYLTKKSDLAKAYGPGNSQLPRKPL